LRLDYGVLSLPNPYNVAICPPKPYNVSTAHGLPTAPRGLPTAPRGLPTNGTSRRRLARRQPTRSADGRVRNHAAPEQVDCRSRGRGQLVAPGQPVAPSDHRDLAQQVDQLLDGPDEVAGGEVRAD
jgi:hypothetical protein